MGKDPYTPGRLIVYFLVAVFIGLSATGVFCSCGVRPSLRQER